VLDVDIEVPFPRLTHADSMERFGNDKPDLRFGLELKDMAEPARGSSFKVFLDALSSGGRVKAINGMGMAGLSRREMDLLTAEVQALGAKGLAWIKVKDGFESPITKFFPDQVLKEMAGRLEAAEGDVMLFVADRADTVHDVLGRLRLELGKRLGLVKPGFKFTWICDFPLLEWDAEDKRFAAMHHPFTAPNDEDEAALLSASVEAPEALPGQRERLLGLRAKAYDIVLNGYEIGGGSIRNHRREVQKKMFGILGIADEEARTKFGFLLEALDYGAPPHGGIALGLDRIMMLMVGAQSIRDVIAFPKTQKALCLMSGAPSRVEQKQLRELHIRVDQPL
jgi:aspartyl-tRNA synthetase